MTSLFAISCSILLFRVKFPINLKPPSMPRSVKSAGRDVTALQKLEPKGLSRPQILDLRSRFQVCVVRIRDVGLFQV